MQEWTETMVGGSAEAERIEFEQLARDIMRVQLTTAKTASTHGVPHGVARAFHAKSTLALDTAELRFVDRGTHELKGVPDTWQLFALES